MTAASSWRASRAVLNPLRTIRNQAILFSNSNLLSRHHNVKTSKVHLAISTLSASACIKFRPFFTTSTSNLAHPVQDTTHSGSISRYDLKEQADRERMDRHNESVREIASTVRSFHERKQKFRINHGSTNSTRPRDHKNSIKVGHLNNIISVDTDKRTCLVEPNVPMDRLVEGTLAYGLVPPVVMEFPGITVGGGYAGTSGESSSFKHGYFDRTINYVEMILADGTVTTCSRNDKPDLFNGAAGALGTIGITTLVELQLIPATKYVETTYHPVGSTAEALSILDNATNDATLDYVDGILFSSKSGAIVTGRMTDTLPSPSTPIQTFSHARDPWFYTHVQSSITSSVSKSPTTTYIPLAEYLFRYDRGGFWVGRSAFSYFHVPFTKFFRWFLDDFLHTRMMYTALHASGQSRMYVVQDLAVPYGAAGEFIKYCEDKFGIWPLWLCPLKTPVTGQVDRSIEADNTEDARRSTATISTPKVDVEGSMHPKLSPKHVQQHTQKGEASDKMLNVGLWGFGPKDFDTFVKLNQDLEATLLRLGGVKWLYAHTYYDEAEFWSVYDREWYDGLRQRYGAQGLPSVYEKVKVDVDKERAASQGWKDRWIWKSSLGGLFGIWKAIRSGSYKAARKSTWRWKDGEDGIVRFGSGEKVK